MNLRLNTFIPKFFKHRELGLYAFLALFAGVLYNYLYQMHLPDIFIYGENVWFQGDVSRVYDSITSRFSYGHYRAKVHPLFSILTTPLAFVFHKVFNLSWYQTVQVLIVSVASIWALAIYALLRATGCLRVDAFLLSMFGLASSAALFWLSVPESYGLGSVSITVALTIAAVASHKSLPAWLHVLVSSFSLSITVTNWMTGILSTFTTNPYKRAAKITLCALMLVIVVWLIQKQIFPKAVFFIGDTEESKYIFYPTVERSIGVFKSFFFHTIFTPNLDISGYNTNNWPMLSIQDSALNVSNILSTLATTLWAILLLIGFWGLLTLNQLTPLRVTLGLTIVGQLVLHLIYGEETFLYSLHFLPLLILLSALATLTRLRKFSIAIVVILIPLCAFNNWQQYEKATALMVSPRQEVLNQIALRPTDSWTRFDSHALLAVPDSLENDKAYIEPGGSISPKVGSFGLSIWITDQRNALVSSSDLIKASDTHQAMEWPESKSLPNIITQTPYYKTVASIQPDNSLTYTVDFSSQASLNPSLLIRSVGPAGGPIRTLYWKDQKLVINDVWHITFNPAPLSVNLGEEGNHKWFTSEPMHSSVKSQNGWAFANIQLDATQSTNINIKELRSEKNYPHPLQKISSELYLKLPDRRFRDSLNAQIAHIMMGLVNNETRPGDPTNYPLSWERDGAYILVALAKAGQLQKAEALSKAFAEQDFFGGFGAEADAPGLSLWALNQVSSQLNDSTYDASVWPHVKRKAELIEKMLTTKERMYQNFTGKIVPQHIADPEKNLVAEPAKDGLIVGRMDHHRPLPFVNAVSYLGLLEAADFAHRLGKVEEQVHWLTLARQLKIAWGKAYVSKDKNERAFISALWPTWIAQDNKSLFQTRLAQHWQEQHDENNQFKTKPLWTYFNIAEAHQWLYLGQPNPVWSTLEWFWQHQSMPNLYAWWEGEGEENSFGIWQNVRGWVNPKNVNPHYWTAAEMALLQMDMLAFMDTSKDKPTLIIGAGIPSSWLDKPMDVKQLRVGHYIVDWHWENNMMKVVLTGKQSLDVKLAAHFPARAHLIVTYR